MFCCKKETFLPGLVVKNEQPVVIMYFIWFGIGDGHDGGAALLRPHTHVSGISGSAGTYRLPRIRWRGRGSDGSASGRDREPALRVIEVSSRSPEAERSERPPNQSATFSACCSLSLSVCWLGAFGRSIGRRGAHAVSYLRSALNRRC
ncbi:unnamed protein product [Brassicogethes aeneus]|uniref:Uncharacterized protein n=1 Tax=Brassicogethes aeneus TaxID=1431903 RepID=A0A9P0BFI7_BRAAE|nr:unnamed protein product [Brassicogethes aeneus]